MVKSCFGLLAVLIASPGAAQTAPLKAASVVGEVTAVDAQARRLTLRTDAKESIAVVPEAEASFLHAKPGATSLADAAPAAFGEIAVGDRVLARGVLAQDRTSIAARQVVVMTRADISQKQERERAEWRRRGIVGVVTAVDPKGEISLEVRAAGGPQRLAIPAEGKIVFRRYAPDSVKFGDAKPGSLAEIEVGDQLRALGEHSPDGTRFLAEQIVSGAFHSVVGTVVAVDAAKGEVVLNDADTQKPLTVVVGPDAMLRRFPAELGARFVGRRPGAEPAGGTGPGSRAAGGAGLPDSLERLPPIAFADLKPGDTIGVSSTKGRDPARLTAITLVSGLQALIGEPRGRRGPEIAPGLPPGVLDIGIGLP